MGRTTQIVEGCPGSTSLMEVGRETDKLKRRREECLLAKGERMRLTGLDLQGSKGLNRHAYSKGSVSNCYRE